MPARKPRSGYACAVIAILTLVLVACNKGDDGGGGGGSGGGVPVSPPAPDFNSTPLSTGTSTPVNFTDASAGSPTAWSWDFENDSVVDSTVQNPSHIYAAPGVYSVTLLVSNAGGSNSLTKTNYITVLAAPVANFTGAPTTTDTVTPVNFADTSTGTPTSWAWDFNNDTVTDSAFQSPSYIYPAAGTYTVTLTASNAAGSDSLTRTNYITVTAAASGTADLDVDTNRNGTIEAADDATENVWNAAGGAVYYLNQDDDDNNNQEDYLDSTSAGNDPIDLARVIVRQYVNPPAGGTAVVAVSTTAQARVRLFQLNGATWTSVYSTGASFSISLAAIAAGDLTFGIEGRDLMTTTWDGRVTLTLEVRNSGGTIVSSDAVILRVAPPLFSTNLWTAEEYHLVNVGNAAIGGNLALRAAMQTICTAGGITYREAAGATYANDRWLQDSSEAAVIQLPTTGGPRRVIDNVVQLARWRECDDWCEDVLWGPDFDFFRRFSTNTASTNYGGNLEVCPPVAGKPYGYIMTGGGNGTLIGTTTSVNRHMVQVYRDFMNTAAIQGNFEITSEWLAVGHVDEFTAFVPAPNTTRGWVVLIASPDRAYQVLQATQNAGQGAAAVFAGRSGWATTVNAILADTALATLNGQVQARIDTARNQLKAATGLTDADFIELPTLFENVGGNQMAAYNPGVVNLICLPSTNGTTYLAIPDPEGPDIIGVDQWQADINALLAPLDTATNPYAITYVDIFFSYHTNLGEAHCGSNFVRTPPNDDWWNK